MKIGCPLLLGFTNKAQHFGANPSYTYYYSEAIIDRELNSEIDKRSHSTNYLITKY